MGLTSSWCRIKHKEIVIHLFIYFHNTSFVTASVTIVRRTEYRHDLLLMRPIKTIHYKLMGTRNHLETIGVIEVLRDVLSKCKASTSWRDAPTMPFIGVRPEEVTHRSFVRNFHLPVQLSDLFKSVQIGR